MSMLLQDSDITEIVALLSAERLSALTELTGSVRAAVELHQETLSLGASLLNVTATIEISLRNAVCDNLEEHFGTSDWLLHPPVPFQWRTMELRKVTGAQDSARRAKYAKLSQAQKIELDKFAYPQGRPPNTPHLRRAKDRRRQINVSDGSVIAELTFYFWKRLFGPDYEQLLWRTTLKRVFPNKQIPRAAVAENLEIVYQTRNRLAHHEPVLRNRFYCTMSSIQFVVENLGMRKPTSDSALAKLIELDLQAVRSKAEALHERLDQYRP